MGSRLGSGSEVASGMRLRLVLGLFLRQVVVTNDVGLCSPEDEE